MKIDLGLDKKRQFAVRLFEVVFNAWDEVCSMRYWHRRYYCTYCERRTKHIVCDNCGKYYCMAHCEWDNDSYYEMPNQPDYPICYWCD